MKKAYCLYDTTTNIEYSAESLRIYLPTKKGYVNYNIVHSVREEINANVWRLGQAFACDDSLNSLYELTRFGAEWDMAVTIVGRDDFIGGSNHGDETTYFIELEIDGIRAELSSLDKVTEFESLKFTVESIGFDPDDHESKALIHKKEYLINDMGFTVDQKVKWLSDYSLESCYLAMMPPLKSLTETFFTDNKVVHKTIEGQSVINGTKSATVYGKESGAWFSMSILEYPRIMEKTRFLLTDNGGSPYNKMYFVVCSSHKLEKGEEWHSSVRYNIDIENK